MVQFSAEPGSPDSPTDVWRHFYKRRLQSENWQRYNWLPSNAITLKTLKCIVTVQWHVLKLKWSLSCQLLSYIRLLKNETCKLEKEASNASLPLKDHPSCYFFDFVLIVSNDFSVVYIARHKFLATCSQRWVRICAKFWQITGVIIAALQVLR